MSIWSLTWAYLRANALGSALHILLLALGVATITTLLLLDHQLDDRVRAETRGIDMVVGAKGSPLQIILSGVFHLDTPTGNIPLEDVRWLQEHPLVAQTIPLALGDSYRGFRIVGTEHALVDHYGAELAEGELWDGVHDVVIGATVARDAELELGDTFYGVHGIATGDGPVQGEVHDDHPYRVAGILAPRGRVIDRLVLGSVESVWHVHDHTSEAEGTEAIDRQSDDDHAHRHEHDDHGHNDHGHEDRHDRRHAHEHDHGHEAGTDGDEYHAGHEHHEDGEITALLLQYRSPLAAVTLPRLVNARDGLQAASPAQEITRLMGLLGVGLDALRLFGWILLAAGGLGLFVGLYNALRQRRYDLMIMRSLGARRRVLVGQVLLESLTISILGALLGLLLGHLAMDVLGAAFSQGRQLAMDGRLFLWQELQLFAGVLIIGILAALIPAWQAYRTPIATALTKP